MRYSVILLLLFSGCNLQPNYERPYVDLDPTWREPTCVQDECSNLAWWDHLGDPVLNELIETGLANNQDLKVAIYRVDEFCAKWGIAKSLLYPQIQGSGIVERDKVSTTLGSTGIVPNSTFDVYGLLLNASYQVDLWGKFRSGADAAYAEVLSQVENRRTVILSLIQAIATAYIDLKQYQLQRFISKETLETRVIGYDLSVIRYDLGLTSEMQVEQAYSLVESAEVSVEQFDLLIVEQENLLSFLIGFPSGPILGDTILTELQRPPCVPAALPCELINQRPDILAAEQELIAANADIGVARALFLPEINLIAGIDTESSFTSNLFRGPASTWEYGANFLQEIFTGGKLTSNLQETYAVKSELVHNYQSTVLNAIKEVNDALVGYEIHQELFETQKKRVETLKDYFRLATLRYTEGLVDYLNVLDAERELFGAQLEEVGAMGDSFKSLIDIYSALGGDWVLQADTYSQCMNGR